MTRLSDEAWRAKMEGKTFRKAEPLPLFDAAPPPATPPAKGLDGMLAQHERDHAAALGIPPSVLAAAPPPSTAAQETAARPPIVAIVCSRGRGGGCRRVELPNDEAADPWARARPGSALAASKWTPAQVEAVDAAILYAARTLGEFTSDDVWRFAPGVPVTKGIAGRLMAARHAGLIYNTGETRTAARGGPHDHAQRLTVWKAVRP